METFGFVWQEQDVDMDDCVMLMTSLPLFRWLLLETIILGGELFRTTTACAIAVAADYAEHIYCWILQTNAVSYYPSPVRSIV